MLLPARPPPHLPPQQQPRPLPQPLRIRRVQLELLIGVRPPVLLVLQLIQPILLLPHLRPGALGFLRPDKRALPLLPLHHLDRHLLPGAPAPEPARAGVARDLALHDVGAHAQDLHPVQVVEVVFEVELVEGERDEEGGEVRGLGGRVEEGEPQGGSVGSTFCQWIDLRGGGAGSGRCVFAPVGFCCR